jgi:hypothetical protein
VVRIPGGSYFELVSERCKQKPFRQRTKDFEPDNKNVVPHPSIWTAAGTRVATRICRSSFDSSPAYKFMLLQQAGTDSGERHAADAPDGAKIDFVSRCRSIIGSQNPCPAQCFPPERLKTEAPEGGGSRQIPTEWAPTTI